MEFLLYLKATISRLLFIGHGICAVYIYWEYQINRGKQSEDDKYDFFLLTPLFFILVEAAVTLGYRKGIEFKYFWPSGFLYITCLVPIIWMIELDLFDQRTGGGGGSNGNTNTNTNETAEAIALRSQQQRGQRFLNAKLISNEGVKKVSELGLVLGVIVGRWLIPRGTLTRDQLSALLLGYVSNSADILELFSTFEEQQVFDKKEVTIGVMVVFTISLYQFPLVTTATMETDDTHAEHSGLNDNKIHHPATYSEQLRLQNGGTSKRNYIEKAKARRNNLLSLSDKGDVADNRTLSDSAARTNTLPPMTSTVSNDKSIVPKRTLLSPINRTPKAINETQGDQHEDKVKCMKVHGEVFSILVTLLMQDGPFFILRFYLIIRYSVASELHIFFTCKNAIVSVLLVYRSLVLSCSPTESEEELLDRTEGEAKLRNIQRALETMKLKDIEATNMYVK